MKSLSRDYCPLCGKTLNRVFFGGGGATWLLLPVEIGPFLQAVPVIGGFDVLSDLVLFQVAAAHKFEAALDCAVGVGVSVEEPIVQCVYDHLLNLSVRDLLLHFIPCLSVAVPQLTFDYMYYNII